uniref:VPS35 endosomal protein-sorting factor-like n=1 Tax=Amphimedon queenslandica TaxID=400682 RepID=A0A1X7VFK8_AMPQE
MEADKVKHRLEQLDDLEDGGQQETLNLSQKEYIRKIDTMNRSLTDAWQRDQRVMSLKITIQCSKLLADNGVIHFYPSKFVLITDILDNFGNLVFERIREKSAYTPPNSSKSIELPKNFSPEQVPESAKETCRNWFFKIASIRELVPRFYVEAALLNCYRFLTDQEFTQALIRLTKMTRGIGDPLVAAYARAYLCRVGQTVATSGREYVVINFTDYLNTFSQLNSDFVQNILAVQSLDMSKYLRLFVPAVEWILQCVAHKGTEKLLEEVIGLIKEKTSSGLVYNALISSFDPRFISKRALEFADLIKDSEETVVSKYELYVSLGNCVVIVDPPEKQRMPLLNNVWKPVMKLEDPSQYISCAQVWIEYVAKHFTRKEVNTLLGDIIKHMMPGKAFEDHYSEILSIVNKILPYFTDFSQLFSMDKFLPYIDLCQKESVKVEASKNIVRSFTVKQTTDTNDPLIINGMMYLCKILHDSLDAMSLNDDRRQISELITSFLGKISFGRDFEQQLSFYVEARAAFSNLDAVLIYLVHNVNLLAMQTRLLVKGNHNRKTASFVRACIAYSFITVPSIDAILYRLNLYLISGRVAVANGALSQGDAFFKAAVTALKEVPQYMDMDHRRQSTEDFAQSFFCNLFSTLLVIPDNPDREPLLLIRSALNSLEDYNWIENSDTKYKVYSSAICLLAAVCQDKYLYSIDKVDSNDALYSGEKKFTNEVVSLVSKLLAVIWNHIKGLTSPDDAKRQAKLALGLFARLSVHSDVTDPAVSKMLVNIWNIAQRENSGLSGDLLARIKSLYKLCIVLNENIINQESRERRGI